ncbi:MAG TPA: SRPBCC family protein [Casimicrobiaceae bacterium]|nr:SRPBCC family protein [Casimicrobiaceae bacterium]
MRIERQGDTMVITAHARLVADPVTAWAVLTDYARYRDFIPGVRASRVVERRGSAVVVEQSDEFALSFLRMPVRVMYEIDEFPRARLQSRARASGLPPLSSTFVLERTEAGVTLEYAGYIGPGLPLLGRLEQPALQRAAIRDFEALVDEIERRAATRSTRPPHAAPARVPD